MKKDYNKPQAIAFTEELNGGVPGALWGAALMVGRALAAAMKGGIDLASDIEHPKTLQQKDDYVQESRKL